MSTNNPDILNRLLLARTGKVKKEPAGPKRESDKAKSEKKEEKKARGSNPTDKEQWFLERRKEMTGKCLHCGGRSCKGDNMFFRHSIAHILPKKLFPSVATHPLNWIELCFWENNCHGNLDNHTLDLIELNCFDTVIERFVAMYPEIGKKERRNIPDVLKQYVL